MNTGYTNRLISIRKQPHVKYINLLIEMYMLKDTFHLLNIRLSNTNQILKKYI